MQSDIAADAWFSPVSLTCLALFSVDILLAGSQIHHTDFELEVLKLYWCNFFKVLLRNFKKAFYFSKARPKHKGRKTESSIY